MPTCSPTCCAPTARASRPCSRSPTRSARCAPWCAAATTWSPPACSSPTSCAACSSRSGPAPPPSSPTSTRRSRSPSSSATPPPTAPARSARSAWPRFLAQHSYCGRRSPAELARAAARRARRPQRRARSRRQGRRSCARSPRTLTALVAQIAQLSARIEHAVAELPDGQHRHVACRAPAASAPHRSSPSSAMCASASPPTSSSPPRPACAPLTYESGKHRSVAFRWACNHRLRRAVTCFADNSRHASPWAATRLRRARARGCDHPHAIRILARAWIRVLWRMWIDRSPYDPARHRAALAFIALGG